MAEYIERTEELMLAMNAGARAIENTKRYHGAVYTNADVAPVVCCKDCKHYDMGVCLKIYSDGNIHSAAWQKRKSEDFCSYGERNQ